MNTIQNHFIPIPCTPSAIIMTITEINPISPSINLPLYLAHYLRQKVFLYPGQQSISLEKNQKKQ